MVHVSEETAPTFTTKPIIKNGIDENKLIFECQLFSNPKPEIKWFKDERLVKEDNRTRVILKEFEPNKFIVGLEISDVIESDVSNYKITAKNKQGEAVVEINAQQTNPQQFPL